MDAFRWDPCFLTGLPAVDEQHHTLVNLTNQFGAALLSPQGASPAQIEALVQELGRYASYHFSEEEALMLAQGVDGGHLANHRSEHARFLQHVSEMHQGWSDQPSRDNAAALLNFLTNWLAYHILGTDRLMAWLMQAARAGTPVQAALDAFDQSRDPATATLLQAMHQLVHQLSERSRALFELNQTLEARVAERTRDLLHLNQRLETLAMTDALTGLPNRRQAMHRLEQLWQAAQQQGDALSCMMIDADGFKKINDSHGHDAGDAVLCALARCLQQAVRNDDLVCRLGGDEFFILCARTPLDGALHSAAKVHREVAALRVPAGAGVWVGSISVGVASVQPGITSAEALLKAADQGVYLAKARGRNTVASVQTGA